MNLYNVYFVSKGTGPRTVQMTFRFTFWNGIHRNSYIAGGTAARRVEWGIARRGRRARVFNPKMQQKMKIPAETVVKFLAKATRDTVLRVKK
jgi:hypothetical protein